MPEDIWKPPVRENIKDVFPDSNNFFELSVYHKNTYTNNRNLANALIELGSPVAGVHKTDAEIQEMQKKTSRWGTNKHTRAVKMENDTFCTVAIKEFIENLFNIFETKDIQEGNKRCFKEFQNSEKPQSIRSWLDSIEDGYEEEEERKHPDLEEVIREAREEAEAAAESIAGARAKYLDTVEATDDPKVIEEAKAEFQAVLDSLK